VIHGGWGGEQEWIPPTELEDAMSGNDNIKTITSIYEAFGRGDVGAILDAVTDDVDWAAEAAGTHAPWYGSHRGHAGVTEFFTAFGTACEVEEFTPKSLAANDTDVMAVVRCRAKVRATGKVIDMDLHHWFQFRDGKVAYYRGTEDTAQTAAAFAG
jgi:ketosteroid isomerase-like protein